MVRGEIQNADMALVLHDFSGLLLERGITPTNIDGVIEIDDKEFILIETKFRGAELPHGQRLCLERMSDAIEESGRYSIVLVVDRDVRPGQGQIDAASCLVREFRASRQWIRQDTIGPITLRAFIDKWRTGNKFLMENMKSGGSGDGTTLEQS